MHIDAHWRKLTRIDTWNVHITKWDIAISWWVSLLCLICWFLIQNSNEWFLKKLKWPYHLILKEFTNGTFTFLYYSSAGTCTHLKRSYHTTARHVEANGNYTACFLSCTSSKKEPQPLFFLICVPTKSLYIYAVRCLS